MRILGLVIARGLTWDRTQAVVRSHDSRINGLNGQVESERQERIATQERLGTAINERDAARQELSHCRESLEVLRDMDEVREVLAAEIQVTTNRGHTKHRFQVFDAAGKVVTQEPMNKHDKKADALASARRLAAAKIEVKE